MPVSFPLTIGQDFSGEIAEVGNNVHDFSAGDQVFGFALSGAYAEYADVSVKESAHKPGSIDFVTAASVPTAGLTAWQMIIDEAKVSEGQVVLIHGAAGRCRVICNAGKVEKSSSHSTASQGDADYLKRVGVDQVIDYKSERFEEK
jgi:NADPH:quinone reductase-like Zn-dependent oxidoreductase